MFLPRFRQRKILGVHVDIWRHHVGHQHAESGNKKKHYFLIVCAMSQECRSHGNLVMVFLSKVLLVMYSALSLGLSKVVAMAFLSKLELAVCISKVTWFMGRIEVKSRLRKLCKDVFFVVRMTIYSAKGQQTTSKDLFSMKKRQRVGIAWCFEGEP